VASFKSFTFPCECHSENITKVNIVDITCTVNSVSTCMYLVDVFFVQRIITTAGDIILMVLPIICVYEKSNFCEVCR